MPRIWSAAGLIAGMLSACAPARPPSAPLTTIITATEQPVRGDRSSVPAERWTALSVLTWDDFYDHVRQHAPDLRAARERARAAVSQIDAAGSWGDPRLAGEIAPRTLNSDGELGYGLRLSQPMAWPQRLRAERAQAVAEAQAGVADLQVRGRHHLVQARAAYAEYWLYTQLLSVIRAESIWAEAQIGAAEAMVAGGGPGQDLAMARAELAMLHREHATVSRTLYTNGIAMMVAMLGLPGDATIPPPVAELPPAQVDIIPARQDLLELARGRPEVMAATARLQAAQATLAQASTNRLPDWDVEAGWNTMEDDRAMRFTLGVGVAIPVPDRARAAERSTAQYLVQAAQAERDLARAEADRAVLDAEARLREYAAHIHILRDQEIPAREAAVALAESAQANGQGSLAAGILARRLQFSAKRELLIAEHEFFHWLGELECCIGMALVAPARGASPESTAP